MESIGKQIKAERQRRRLTADELGQMVGRDRQSIYLWESGRSEPAGDALLKLVANGFVAVPEPDEAVA